MTGPTDIEGALKLTVQDLIGLMAELEAKFPKDDLPPNPADVHPLTFAALKNVCESKTATIDEWPLDAVRLHVRSDVEPWKLHKCTCRERKFKT